MYTLIYSIQNTLNIKKIIRYGLIYICIILHIHACSPMYVHIQVMYIVMYVSLCKHTQHIQVSKYRYETQFFKLLRSFHAYHTVSASILRVICIALYGHDFYEHCIMLTLMCFSVVTPAILHVHQGEHLSGQFGKWTAGRSARLAVVGNDTFHSTIFCISGWPAFSARSRGVNTVSFSLGG